jgi:ubiquinol-cytochrome c reductase cytochrome c1 subunit
MKELKILGIVVAISAVLYIGIEPIAHSQLHPSVAPADFSFSDLEKNTKTGDPVTGEQTFMMAGCTGCHGLESQGFPAPMDDATASASFGVVPPDLSTTGYLYDANFLAMLIKNPAVALKVEHKFNDSHPHPMSAFYGLGGDIDQEIADIVVYLQSIAPETVSGEKAYEDACLRCHSIKYDNKLAPSGKEALTTYMATLPPDLSMTIRAKGEKYLTTFINNPQKHLGGTLMPRVGLTQESQEKVISYMQSIGDSKKDEREQTGMYLMIYFAILSIFAILWKKKVWREV